MPGYELGSISLIMMRSRHFFIAISFLCIACILFALYLQLVWRVLPCPMCVLQRYAFIGVAVCCITGFLTKKVRFMAFLAFIVSLIGMGLAFYQLWVISHPDIQCGRDPLEQTINNLWTAKAMPVLFRSESLCSDFLEPIIGLTPPQWSLIWFFIFAVVFVRIMRRG